MGDGGKGGGWTCLSLMAVAVIFWGMYALAPPSRDDPLGDMRHLTMVSVIPREWRVLQPKKPNISHAASSSFLLGAGE